MRRISIKSMMWYVGFIAIGLAALRNANDVWAAVLLTLTLGVLGTSIIARACRQGRERVWWFGFALFGTAYAILAFLPWFGGMRMNLATTHLLGYLTRDPSVLVSRIQIEDRLKFIADVLKKTPPSDPDYNQVQWQYVALHRQLETISNSTTGSTISNRIQLLLPGFVNREAFTQIGHCIFTLLAGLLGAFISFLMYREPEPSSNESNG